ncbi:MAG: DUF1844 domain-containing protein [Bryobacteraceae bacterium]
MPDSTESPLEYPIPPATFTFIVESLLMQAQIQLGLLSFGEKDEEPAPNLPLARHSIDMLAMLQEKTKGNLAVDEQRFLENVLTELRFRFVQVAEEVRKRNEPMSAGAPSPPDDAPRIITADGGKGTKTE